MRIRRVVVVLAVLASVVPLLAGRALAQGRPVVTEKILRASGKGWTFSFQYPQLSVPGALMGVRGIMGDYNRATEQLAQRQLAQFKKDVADYGPPPRELGDVKSTLDATCTVVTNHGVVSVRYEVFKIFAGAAHPASETITTNWLGGGPLITFSDLFASPATAMKTVSRLALADLKAQAKKEGYEIFSPEGAGPDAKNFEAFVIQKSGVMICFQASQVTAYAVGPLQVSIPWKTLKPLLKPEVWDAVSRI